MKKHNYLTIGLLLITVAYLQACTMAKISGKSSKPLLLNNPNVDTEVIQTVNETQLKVFDYTGSIDIYEIVSDVVVNSNADAITNITIKIKSDPATFFINVVTLGIANAYKVDVTGDLVNLPEGIASTNSTIKNKLTDIKPPQNKEVKTMNFNGYLIP